MNKHDKMIQDCSQYNCPSTWVKVKQYFNSIDCINDLKDIWSVTKWILVLSAFMIGVLLFILKAPLAFSWVWMLTVFVGLLWTRRFFH